MLKRAEWRRAAKTRSHSSRVACTHDGNRLCYDVGVPRGLLERFAKDWTSDRRSAVVAPRAVAKRGIAARVVKGAKACLCVEVRTIRGNLMVFFNEQHVAGRQHAVRVDEILDVIGVETHVALCHLDRFGEHNAIAVKALLYLRQDLVEARDVCQLRSSELRSPGRRQRPGT